MKLRGYQEESLVALWVWFRKNLQGAPLLVLPTGAGKSLVLAEMAKAVCRRGVDRRVLILAHRRELLTQNVQELQKLWPEGDIGVYSAGLGQRDLRNRVVVAGIQSVFEKADALGRFNLVIVDEAHLIPSDGEGMYQTLIAGLKAISPHVRFAGLTATPYRLGTGVLTAAGELFTAIAYEVGIKRLIEEGYLSPLVTKASKGSVSMEGVAVRGGEYVAAQMEKRFNRYDKVEQAVKEIIVLGQLQNRKCWLIFAAGVDHAEKINEAFRKGGVLSEVVTGETPPLERERILHAYKAGKVTALVNVDVLTTGFNHPGVDLLAVLRSTKSTSLWVQMCGRASRVAEGKADALILDYGGNALYHGPLDRISISHRWCPLTGANESRVETAKVHACPQCDSVIPVQSRECPDCGYQMIITKIKHDTIASEALIISEPEPPIFVDVVDVSYSKHEKVDKLPTFRADYVLSKMEGVDVLKVSEWVCFEHSGFPGMKAWNWWRERTTNKDEGVPNTVDEAMSRVQELKTAKKLQIKRDGRFWRVEKALEWGKSKADEGDEFYKKTGVNI